MNKKTTLATLFIIAMFLLVSCTKEAGIGGSSTIRGRVYAKYYDKTFTILNGEDYAPEQDVYIIYGDGASYDDRVRTNYDGTFEFNSLEKGDYTVYVYSKDSTLTIPSGVYPVFRKVEITKNHTTYQLPEITIFN